MLEWQKMLRVSLYLRAPISKFTYAHTKHFPYYSEYTYPELNK